MSSSNLIYNLFQHLLIIGLGGVLWSQDCHTPSPLRGTPPVSEGESWMLL